MGKNQNKKHHGVLRVLTALVVGAFWLTEESWQ